MILGKNWYISIFLKFVEKTGNKSFWSAKMDYGEIKPAGKPWIVLLLPIYYQ